MKHPFKSLPAEGRLVLRNPDLAEHLMRALELKGDLPQALSSFFTPVIQALDLTTEDLLYLRRITRWSVGVNMAAVAGQFAVSHLVPNSSPAPRAMLAMVDAVLVSNPNAATMPFQYGVSILGSGQAITSQGNPLDDRQIGAPRAFYAAGGNNQAAPSIPSASAIASIPAGGSLWIYPKAVLTGKDNTVNLTSFFVAGQAVNQALQVVYHWRERAITVSELI
jgi:hypothetical protein